MGMLSSKSQGDSVRISLKLKLKSKQQNSSENNVTRCSRAPYNSQHQREMITHHADSRTVSMQRIV